MYNKISLLCSVLFWRLTFLYCCWASADRNRSGCTTFRWFDKAVLGWCWCGFKIPLLCSVIFLGIECCWVIMLKIDVRYYFSLVRKGCIWLMLMCFLNLFRYFKQRHLLFSVTKDESFILMHILWQWQSHVCKCVIYKNIHDANVSNYFPTAKTSVTCDRSVVFSWYSGFPYQ